MAEHRWSKFWWQDWQREPSLRMCSLAARGLWIELLAIAHEGCPYGHVTVNGRSPSPKQIGGIVGCGEREVVKLIAELEDAGVFSRTDQGVIFSRRMVRDQQISEKGRNDKLQGLHGNGSIPPSRGPSSGGSSGSAGDINSQTEVDEVNFRAIPEKTQIRKRNDRKAHQANSKGYDGEPSRGASSNPSSLDTEAESEAESDSLNPSPSGEGLPRRRRALGTNLRETGENPRALGTNPRANGTNPRADRGGLRPLRESIGERLRRELGIEDVEIPDDLPPPLQ